MEEELPWEKADRLEQEQEHEEEAGEQKYQLQRDSEYDGV
jgi:hypothetical protein